MLNSSSNAPPLTLGRTDRIINLLLSEMKRIEERHNAEKSECSSSKKVSTERADEDDEEDDDGNGDED